MNFYFEAFLNDFKTDLQGCSSLCYASELCGYLGLKNQSAFDSQMNISFQ